MVDVNVSFKNNKWQVNGEGNFGNKMAAYAEVAARYLRRIGGVAMLSESVDGVSKTLSQMPGSIVDGPTAPFATGDLLAALKSYRRIPIGG
jgi:hypothetical protein